VAYVTVEELTKEFGGKPPVTAVKDVDLDIQDGEFVVLLGPSGCGKTTTLRCIAGLDVPTAGRISLGGRTVFDAPQNLNLSPNKRSIGVVFQSYALWPHMTVRKNIAYPLKARGLKQKIKAGWLDETARLVDCADLLDRYPMQLSGGQQQRVALARGLVARPDLLLLDEPLSNLDARLRASVRSQLHELHSKLRFTAIFVTHDQSEALALGDRLAVMRNGTIEQFDTPQQIFDSPATEYVADFVGMENLLLCELRGSAWICNGEPAAGEAPIVEGARNGFVARVRLRPDDLHVEPVGASPIPGTTNLAGNIVNTEYGGRHLNLVVSVGDSRLHARVATGGLESPERTLSPGQPVRVAFRASDARCFESPGSPDVPTPARQEPVRV
jgi:iron(III) transport system ATP-binding protein